MPEACPLLHLVSAWKQAEGCEGCDHDFHKTVHKNHCRIETRRCRALGAPEYTRSVDMAFREDASCIHTGHTAHNLSILRRGRPRRPAQANRLERQVPAQGHAPSECACPAGAPRTHRDKSEAANGSESANTWAHATRGSRLAAWDSSIPQESVFGCSTLLLIESKEV